MCTWSLLKFFFWFFVVAFQLRSFIENDCVAAKLAGTHLPSFLQTPKTKQTLSSCQIDPNQKALPERKRSRKVYNPEEIDYDTYFRFLERINSLYLFNSTHSGSNCRVNSNSTKSVPARRRLADSKHSSQPLTNSNDSQQMQLTEKTPQAMH